MDALPDRDDVERAARTIAGRVRRTPLLEAPALGAGVVVKAELLQHAGSFKARGVTSRLAALGSDERSRGVVGVSAGNHAMALAWGATREGIDSLLVTFRGASPYKLSRTRELGATVEVVDGDPAAAFARMEEIVAETGRVVVHPFDDPLVVAGQGTVGLEIVEDADGLDTVVVPAGGGGLVAGITAAVAPAGVRVIAVEPEGSAALGEALAHGAPVPVVPHTRAGGLDAPYAGDIAVGLCQRYRVEAVTVSDEEIEAAMRRVYADVKLACEPAAAAGVAAVLRDRDSFGRVAIVVSGGNVAADTASAILAGR
ncbi:MAG: threonine/serine dehydratase [Gaiellales bacterium]